MTSLPAGTVTFLFTDIEGSTRLAREHRETWEMLRARHHAILQEAIACSNGYVFQIIGDAFCAAFHRAGDALKAALAAQRGLQSEPWGQVGVRVRMGIHTGEAEVDGKDYRGYLTLCLVQRVMSAGHGGQVLLSQVTENLLRDELPSGVSLRDLGEHTFKDVIHPVRVFQLVAPGLQSDFPALKTRDIPPHHLPVQLTNFIGREKELAEIAEALDQNRLVTIIGSGGTGKTRLAIEAGVAQFISAQTDYRFANGVYFVALAPVETTEAIVPTIAAALGFAFYEGGEPRQQLLNYLREKSMLLILDNFEHLLAGADLIIEILNTAPQVKVLVTSRTRLNIEGEQLFHLTGMDFPNWELPQDAIEYSAIKLFLQTARRVRPNFELTTDNLKYVVRLCRLVEGIPLGILLAASWMEMLSPEEIAAEIEKSLDFLETRQHDLPARQQSMRAVFDYSWKLLTSSEQNVFMKASVFRGGFTREAAQQVTGASLHDLIGLVDKSLLQRNHNGRYEIHELVRQYGLEKLSSCHEDEQSTRNLHCSYFAEYLHQREADLHGENQRAILVEIEAEIENIKISWNWAVEHLQIERLADSLGSMGELYESCGWLREGAKVVVLAIQRLSNVKDKDHATQLLVGRLLMLQGILCSGFDSEGNVDHLLQSSVAIFRELGALREAGYALQCYGSLHWYRNSGSYCQESLEIFQKCSDQRGIALASKGLAWAALHQGYYPLAKRRFQDSLSLAKEICDQKEIVRSLEGLGYVCWVMGEYQEAKHYHEEMLALSKEIGDQISVASALANLGVDFYGLREYPRARKLWLASLALYREMGDLGEIANQLGDLAEVALAEGDSAQAMQLSQESLDYYAFVLDEPHSWEFRIMGKAALRMGNLKMARTYLHQSLQQAMKIQRWGFALLALVGVAELFAKQEKNEHALELLALVISHHASWQMAKDQAVPLIAELEAKLPPDVVRRTKERGCARDLNTTVAELLDELKN